VASGARVLIVEDDADMREILTLVLEAEGHEVLTAADGVTGLTLYENYLPHVLITDLNLPGLDGLSIIAGLRARSPEAKIIAVSGNYDGLRTANALGATAVLRKPVDVPALVAATRSVLQDAHGAA
jgi:two-component system, NtrC family, response regulator